MYSHRRGLRVALVFFSSVSTYLLTSSFNRDKVPCVAGESMSNKTFHVANWHLNHRTGPPRPSGDREIVGRMERMSKGVG